MRRKHAEADITEELTGAGTIVPRVTRDATGMSISNADVCTVARTREEAGLLFGTGLTEPRMFTETSN